MVPYFTVPRDCRMLVRDPAERVTAPALDALLRAELSRDMPNVTLNGGEVHDEAPRELAL